MKKLILITLILITNSIFSQNKFLDFIVTHNNDTIYGNYKINKLLDINKKAHKINSKKTKSIRFQDEIYNLILSNNKDFFSENNDSLISISDSQNGLFKKERYFFARTIDKKKRKDYEVYNETDTIYGKFKTSFLGFKKLVTDSTKNHSSNLGLLTSFRKKGSLFFIKKKLRVKAGNLSDLNEVELLYNGKRAKLYQQHIRLQGYNYSEYYIEINGKLEYILPSRFSRIVMRIMPENKELIEKLKKRKYTYYDIYKVVKYFNESS